ncbi:DUF4091 domain-containing protein [Paenibacillus dakarensis]|uniref:DUF4091 domain-containing protein n=1 Tax=Paenibacillus dakarensis TaxID=1527293 RepID=UPI0006D5B5CC|nr:DUF4091 domain-containing protein [Paenibacillus dakarensis]
MSQLQFMLAGSLEKVLPKQAPTPLKSSILSGLWGETLSFQLAYHCEGQGNYRFHLKLSSPLNEKIRIRKVELVPAAYPCHAEWDDDYLTTEPGLLPDLLRPLDPNESIKAVPAQWRALWLDIKLDEGMTEPEYPVTVSVQDLQGAELWSATLMIRPIPVQLPEQKLLHTEWMHTDCLVDYYKVPAFSEEHWRILDQFIASAADHGINMLLTPVFTPPLDTVIGGERTTVQLVDVIKNGDQYEFDFSKLGRWIGLCRKHGITNLEIAHLFTQWGAEFAPKIIASVNGTEQRIFGWDTPATGEAYKAFLHSFLPELKAYLKEQNILEHTWFHISDEPHENQKGTYAAAKAVVKDLLADCRVIDALSSFELYQEGVVEKPVPCNDHIQPFLDAGVPNLWTYYCTAQQLKVSNRFMSMPSSRNRILGTQLYLYHIEGFLHWGFNFYNNQYSIKAIDPFLVTDAGEAFPSGDPFLVYPAPDGSAYDSIRGMVFKEALYDLRALECLESLKGRETVERLINEGVQGTITFDQYPKGPEYLISLREKINREIAASL